MKRTRCVIGALCPSQKAAIAWLISLQWPERIAWATVVILAASGPFPLAATSTLFRFLRKPLMCRRDVVNIVTGRRRTRQKRWRA